MSVAPSSTAIVKSALVPIDSSIISLLGYFAFKSIWTRFIRLKMRRNSSGGQFKWCHGHDAPDGQMWQADDLIDPLDHLTDQFSSGYIPAIF